MNYEFQYLSDYICISTNTHIQYITKLCLLMMANPRDICFSDSTKTKYLNILFPKNKRIGKLSYLFNQKIVFNIWWNMKLEDKITLYNENVIKNGKGNKPSLSNILNYIKILDLTRNINNIDKITEFRCDNWTYPVGKLTTHKDSKTIEENYWQFTAMPLEDGKKTGYLYLLKNNKFGLSNSKIFLKNDKNKALPTIWQSMYEVLDKNGNNEKGFFLGGGQKPNFNLKDIKYLRENLVNPAEIRDYIKQENSRIAEKYIEIKDYNSNNLKQKQDNRFKDLKIKTVENKDAIMAVKEFLSKKISILQSILKEKDLKKVRSKYNEKWFQQFLLEVFPFIFPKYTHFIREYNFHIDGNSMKKNDIPDFLASTFNFSVDILEIKTPYFNLFNKTTYRKNYVFYHEIQGLISQSQKYIYNLERQAIKQEKKITEAFNKDGANFGDKSIHIRSPKAIVIVGRTPKNKEEIRDLEIYKRRYQDISEFLTYDEILEIMEQRINIQTKVIYNN